MARTLTLLLLVGALCAGRAARSAPVGRPKGPVILTVGGDISMSNSPRGLQMDRSMLEKLKSTSILARSPHHDNQVKHFTGIRLSDLALYAGASSGVSAVQLRGVNGYFVEMPMADVQAYPVLLATQIDGKPFDGHAPWVSRIDFRNPLGPVMVAYPNQDYVSARFSDPWMWASDIAVVNFVASDHAWGAPQPGETLTSQEKEGLHVARKVCLFCHEIQHVGGRVGPTLDDILRKRDRQYVLNYIRNPQALDPKSEMPRLAALGRKFTESQLLSIVEYLQFVNRRK